MDNKNKVLLVEDQAIIRLVHRSFLEKMGFQVDTAVNGKAALEMFLHRMYHLIILDAGLPEISGVEVGKQIRKFEKKNKKMRTPIVLLSAHPFRLLKRWCKEAEIDSFASKPTCYGDLYLMLKNHLNSNVESADF